MRIINTLARHALGSPSAILGYWDSGLLSDLYFSPKGVSSETRDAALGSPRFGEQVESLDELLAGTDVASACQDMLMAFERETGQDTSDGRLYLILGCGTTTIYTVEVDGEKASVLRLESIGGDLNVLRMLLAHEYTHVVRQRLVQGDIFESCLGERLVTEGIAECFSEEMVPGRREAEYCIVDDATVTWVRQHEEELDELTSAHMADASLMETLFYMFAEIDFPVRCGYVYGFDLVRRHLSDKGARVKDILGTDWRDIVDKEDRTWS
jgi:hypothetical protein